MHWLESRELVAEKTNVRVGIATSPSDPGMVTLYISDGKEYHPVSLTRYEAESLADVMLNTAQRCGIRRAPFCPQEKKEEGPSEGT